MGWMCRGKQNRNSVEDCRGLVGEVVAGFREPPDRDEKKSR